MNVNGRVGKSKGHSQRCIFWIAMNWKRFLRRSKSESVGPVVAPQDNVSMFDMQFTNMMAASKPENGSLYILFKDGGSTLMYPSVRCGSVPAHGNNIRIRNIPGLQRLKKGFCHGPTSTIYYAWGSKELVCTTSNFKHNSITMKFNCENTKITR